MLSPEHIGLVSAAITKNNFASLSFSRSVGHSLCYSSLKDSKGKTLFPVGEPTVKDRSERQVDDKSLEKSALVSVARRIAAIVSHAFHKSEDKKVESSEPRDGAWSDPANYNRAAGPTYSSKFMYRHGGLPFAEASAHAAEHYCDNMPIIGRIRWIKLLYEVKNDISTDIYKEACVWEDGKEDIEAIHNLIKFIQSMLDKLIMQLIFESKQYKSLTDYWNEELDYSENCNFLENNNPFGLLDLDDIQF